MLGGEKLQEFDFPETAARHYLLQLSREALEKVNGSRLRSLAKMRLEREAIGRGSLMVAAENMECGFYGVLNSDIRKMF